MAQQVADEEERTNQKRGLVSNGEGSSSQKKKLKSSIDEECDDEEGEEEEEEEEEDKEEEDIWMKWKEFLDDPVNSQNLMQLSPEKHRVIWYGRLLRRRSCLPWDLYSRLKGEVSFIEAKFINPFFFVGTMAVVEAASRDGMALRIDDLDNISVEGQSLVAEKKLLTIILGNLLV
ncbi:uncharacterized protein EV154DRAFT_40327 [Mucor mucedo]|uniref:uncharacterized protein n=1 Tax=Mucor mucedo TaxID=29922 RepID=UPI00222065C6|nr:uncharacterized protein EV154DRAFT_40327 [Mucor mucedo]KAI7882132.1 hypothetical protein EV154DRAFT_40327 [Mucor mucedo]